MLGRGESWDRIHGHVIQIMFCTWMCNRENGLVTIIYSEFGATDFTKTLIFQQMKTFNDVQLFSLRLVLIIQQIYKIQWQLNVSNMEIYQVRFFIRRLARNLFSSCQFNLSCTQLELGIVLCRFLGQSLKLGLLV